MKTKDIPESKIAWVLCNVLEEITERLWLRYDKDFILLAREEEEEEIRAGERESERDPDALPQSDF